MSSGARRRARRSAPPSAPCSTRRGGWEDRAGSGGKDGRGGREDGPLPPLACLLPTASTASTASSARTPLVPQPRLLRLLLEELPRIATRGVGDRDIHHDQLVAFLAPLLEAKPLDAEGAAGLRPGRDLEEDPLPVEGAHLERRPEDRLREVEGDLAAEVEPFAGEEAVGLDLEGDEE